MAAVLRMVHPSELLNCCSERPAKPFGWLDEEEKPRCFECLKPVQKFSRLERLDRAAARSWASCSSMILHDCGREAFAVGSQTVTTRRGEILLAWCSPLFSL